LRELDIFQPELQYAQAQGSVSQAIYQLRQQEDALRKQIATRIRELCSPRHVPNDVFQVPAIPRTLSGKVLEVPVKRLLMGAPVEQVASRDSLANPEALDWFAEFALDRQESNA